jgi:hypothetical protein
MAPDGFEEIRQQMLDGAALGDFRDQLSIVVGALHELRRGANFDTGWIEISPTSLQAMLSEDSWAALR